MKHKKLFLVLFSFMAIIFTSSFSDDKSDGFSLTVEVDNLRNANGIVQFTLYNKEGTIPDEYYKKYYKLVKGKITGNTSKVTFSNLPKGKYAVNILHDENKNGKVDKGFILPVEGVGFSNYQSIGLTNRPNFSKASFELTQNKKVKIKVIYL